MRCKIVIIIKSICGAILWDQPKVKKVLVLHYTTSRKPVRCTGNLLKMKFVIYKKKLSKFVKLKMPNIYLANIHVDLCRALSGSFLLVILVS